MPYVWAAATVGLLLLRKRYPVATIALTGTSTWLYYVTGHWGPLVAVPALAVFSLGRRRAVERRRYLSEQERLRIAREVHDVVAHGLAVIVMQAQGGAAAFAKRPADTLAALDTIVATGRASLADLRLVLAEAGQPMPGLAHLPHLVEQVRQAGTPVELHITGSPRTLPTGVDVSAFRIVQEALTNTLKHAGPAHAWVAVRYAGEDVEIEVANDGNSDNPGDGGGHGLVGMRERVALCGGELESGPRPGGGFKISARLPVAGGAT